MSLIDQFSISRSGGIYYNGTKVMPTDDPVLVIGLGGTGIDAMLRVKNEVQGRMPPDVDSNGKILSPVPGNMAFLAVDTDTHALKKTVGMASINDSIDEFVDLRVNSMSKVISAIVASHLSDPEWEWYDPELKAEGGLDGANGIRQIGRLMLFHNFQRVSAQINAVLKSIVSRAQVKSNNPQIFILTGIGGGTGSGIFLDIAYLIRKLTGDLHLNVKISGYIFTPDLNKNNGGDVASMYRNGFAALKELDYWMSGADHGKHFVQRYPSNFLIDSPDRPFDFCHIITAQDEEKKIISYTKAMEAVGSTLFAFLTGETIGTADGNNSLTSTYDNVMGHIDGANANAPYPANYKYLSVGSSMIEIPYREIMTLLAARMFELLSPVIHRVPDKQRFDQDLMQMQLTYQHLWGDINHNISGDPFANDKKFTYSEIKPNNAPYAQVHQWLNGYAHQELAKNGKHLQGIKEKAFTDYVKALIRAPERGPGYAARMVYSNEGPNLIKTLEGFRQDSLSRASTAASKNSMLKSKLDQAYAVVKKAGLFARASAVSVYNEALREWKENDYSYWAYTELADGIFTLIERLKVYRERIFHPLLSALTMLPGIFRENVISITASDRAIDADPSLKKRYLILATEFERNHANQVRKDTQIAARSFLDKLGDSLKKWVGLELNEIDTAVMDTTDIGGFVSTLVNEAFNGVVSDNLSVEKLLLKKAPVGTSEDDYIRKVMKGLRKAAIPMFKFAEDAGIGLSTERFALISIPDNCSKLIAADKRLTPYETARLTGERSKIQWVSIMAGMPLYVFPEVSEMEAYYTRMVGSEATRKGIHLRYEWREIMPSPLPEGSWPKEYVNEPQKEYDRERNAAIRSAYRLCRKEGIIVNAADDTRDQLLYVADESKLDALKLFGSVSQKKQTLLNLRRSLWSSDCGTIRLKAFGKMGKNVDDNVCENALRFFDESEQIKTQARIFMRYKELAERFDHIDSYINAYFAELFKNQGFDRLLFRSKNDFQPIKIADRMTRGHYAHYEEFQSFINAQNNDAGLARNIETQFEEARKSLLDANGNFIQERVVDKRSLLEALRNQLSKEQVTLEQQFKETPLEQRDSLIPMTEFYTMGIEATDNLLDVLK